jgi:hypothetical protein
MQIFSIEGLIIHTSYNFIKSNKQNQSSSLSNSIFFFAACTGATGFACTAVFD